MTKTGENKFNMWENLSFVFPDENNKSWLKDKNLFFLNHTLKHTKKSHKKHSIYYKNAVWTGGLPR